MIFHDKRWYFDELNKDWRYSPHSWHIDLWIGRIICCRTNLQFGHKHWTSKNTGAVFLKKYITSKSIMQLFMKKVLEIHSLMQNAHCWKKTLWLEISYKLRENPSDWHLWYLCVIKRTLTLIAGSLHRVSFPPNNWTP